MVGGSNSTILGDNTVEWENLATSAKCSPRIFISSDSGFDDWASLNGYFIFKAYVLTQINFDATDFAKLPDNFSVDLFGNNAFTFKWSGVTMYDCINKTRNTSGSATIPAYATYHLTRCDGSAMAIYP